MVLLFKLRFVFEDIEESEVLGTQAVVENASFFPQPVGPGMDKGGVFQLFVPTTVHRIEAE
jgi:hypothetical protein